MRAVMIPMEPHEPPVPPTVVDWHPSSPLDLLYALADAPMSFWRWFDSITGLPHWVLPVYLAAFCAFRLFGWVVREADLGMVPRRETSDRKDASLSGRGVDAEPADGPRRDRWWTCRFCGLQGRLYGTAQQEASEALAHQAVCQRRPDRPGAPFVTRRCTECAAPIDPVNNLLDGLFEDDEPGPTGWTPGTPDWGTAPLLPLRNHAQAELFRQMMTDALRRSKGGPV